MFMCVREVQQFVVTALLFVVVVVVAAAAAAAAVFAVVDPLPLFLLFPFLFLLHGFLSFSLTFAFCLFIATKKKRKKKRQKTNKSNTHNAERIAKQHLRSNGPPEPAKIRWVARYAVVGEKNG